MRQVVPYESPARHPHEIAVTGFSVFVGLVGLALPAGVSRSMETIFPHGWGYVYLTLLLLAGVLTLVGIFNPKIDGALQERVGLLVLASLFLGYAFAVIIVAGSAGFTATMFAVSYAAANIVRSVQITKAINAWRGRE